MQTGCGFFWAMNTNLALVCILMIVQHDSIMGLKVARIYVQCVSNTRRPWMGKRARQILDGA